MVSSLVVAAEAVVVAEKQEIENRVSVSIEDVDGGANREAEEEDGIEEEKVAAAEAAVKGSQEALGEMVAAMEVVAAVMAVRTVMAMVAVLAVMVLKVAQEVVLMEMMVTVLAAAVVAREDLSLLKVVEA